MSSLSNIQKRTLEKLFEMGGGFVCDFSNRTFSEFVVDATDIDIYSERYSIGGESKANRLRTFWKIESDPVVARLLEPLIEYRLTEFVGSSPKEEVEALAIKAREVLAQLKGATTIDDVDALVAGSEPSSAALVRLIQESVQNGRPEEALDRLHTYLTTYVRELCERHGIALDRKTPLHALFGAYVRHLRESSLVESKASLTILKSSIGVLEDLNAVRNDQSLAHPNSLLNRAEATLIFRNISSSLKFIQEVEQKIQAAKEAKAEWDEPEFSDEEIEAAGDAWIEMEMDRRRGK